MPEENDSWVATRQIYIQEQYNLAYSPKIKPTWKPSLSGSSILAFTFTFASASGLWQKLFSQITQPNLHLGDDFMAHSYFNRGGHCTEWFQVPCLTHQIPRNYECLYKLARGASIVVRFEVFDCLKELFLILNKN